MTPVKRAPAYAELHVTTNFSFLRGGSHAQELVETAKALGHVAIGVADRNTLAGVVRAHTAAEEAGLQLLVGARLDLAEEVSVLCYPMDRSAYGRLSRMLSVGKRRAAKGACHLTLTDLEGAAEGQILIALPPANDAAPDFAVALKRLAACAPGRTYLAASPRFDGQDRARFARLARLGQAAGAPMVATNDALYHAPERKPLQDVLTCIREGCTVQTSGFRLHANAERHLKPPSEMARMFKGHEEALARTVEIAQRCPFSLNELQYQYPDEPVPPGKTPQQHLEDLTWAGAQWRYPQGVPSEVAATVRKELALIEDLDFPAYFLTVHDIVRWARDQGILCQGRGSAANSAVCFCLGITEVDPAQTQLLFERFISKERKEPPDIDVDFEHERREEVIQYVYRRYGRERAALTATVISYRPRSAVREVCKALGLTHDIAAALAGTVWGSWGSDIADEHIAGAGLDPANPLIRQAIALTRELLGFPRHLSQHVGGFVLTQGPLVETVPIGNAAMDDRTFIEWDKDDIDALGLMKVDVLALGMLTCIRKCFDLIDAHYGERFALASVPQDDPSVYDMLCRGESLGVFQVESRAQMNMLPRLRPKKFYDLVIQVAIVRPGPIQGDMVHPYLRRRAGKEGVAYPAPAPEHGSPDELRHILGRTLGVPLFQEQAMRIAIDAATFTPDEANGLRRAMATFRKVGTIQNYQEKMIAGMTARGYDPDFARRCFDQIKGFGEYGFPESHAASFAHLVYISSWLKHHHPAVFCAGLLNSQPMGFYAPAQIVGDARKNGVAVRPVDINHSDWDVTLEALAPGPDGETRVAVRLGFRLVDGLSEDVMRAFVTARGAAGCDDMAEVRRRLAACTSRIGSTLEALAAADAFGSLKLDRRQALWAVRALPKDAPPPLFAHADTSDTGPDPAALLPVMPLSEHVLQDYETTRLSLKAHPIAFLRDRYARLNVRTTADAVAARTHARVAVAGLVLVRQRPGSAKGVVFITLEDESGIANIVVWPKVLERFRPVVMGARLMLVRGRVQRSPEGVTHIVAEQLIDRSADLAWLSEDAAQAALDRAATSAHAPWDAPDRPRLDGALSRADEVKRPVLARARGGVPTEQKPGAAPPAEPSLWTHPRNVRAIPKSRDFH